MELDNHDRKVLLNALETWHADGELTADHAERLKQSIVPKKAQQQLANYFFIIALACSLLSFGALSIDEKFLERFRQYFALSNWTIAIITAMLTGVWLIYINRKKSIMQRLFYEMQVTGASVVMLTSLVYLCKEVGSGNGYTGLLIVAALCFATLYYVFRSLAAWIGLLLALMAWYGAFAYTHSTNHSFLWMNYPVRFAVFGLLVLAASAVQQRITALKQTSRITMAFSLIIFFTAMWGVSIFGNYHDLERWTQVRQVQILVYGLLSGATSVAALLWGIKKDDAFLRDTGIIFLLLNLYTRYFEYFWDTLNKGLFFLFIAVSFWFIGRWLMRRQREPKAIQ